jgi:uncharacterized protein YrrD
MGDPVSWNVIEPGWDVVGSDGETLGKVHEVLGDTNVDIFNGLAVSPGLLRHSRYVPSERVTVIEEGRVALDLDRESFGRLDEHGGVAPQARIESDTTDLDPGD